jgi:hypothetical protein
MNQLWRTLSGPSSKEITHTHPTHPALRPTASMDIGGEFWGTCCSVCDVAYSADSQASM